MKKSSNKITANRTILLGITIFLLIFCSISAASRRAPDRLYPLSGHGILKLQVPGSWTESADQPSDQSPPTITFKPGSGESFFVLLSPIVTADREIPSFSDDMIRQSIKEAAEGVKEHTVEKDIEILKIKGKSGSGYYFTVTDKTPKPGEHKFMTQGMSRIGELTATFTVLTNDGQQDVIRSAVAMVKNASHLPNKENNALRNTSDGKYDLYANGSGWSLQFPKSDFEIHQGKHRDDRKSIYFHFTNNNNGLNASFLIQPVTTCLTSLQCRQRQLDNPSESMNYSKYVKSYEMNGFAIVEYYMVKAGPKLVKMVPDVQDLVVNQNNINAHYVKNGYMVNMHLTIMDFSEKERKVFNEFIKSLEFVKR